MTRQFEINIEAINYSENTDLLLPPIDLAEEGFKAGATWADQNPAWISVDNILPQDEELKLVSYIIEKEGKIRKGVGFAIFYKGCWDYPNGEEVEEDIDGRTTKVTHWMPIRYPNDIRYYQPIFQEQ